MTIMEIIVTVNHDRWKVNIKTVSLTGIQDAIDTVCLAEGCPESAIVAIRVLQCRQV
jgi:hypothetical protein